MSDFLTSHWLILNILVPLISTCLIAISNSARLSRYIFISIAPLLLALATFMPSDNTSYALGDWPAPIGIEYILDNLNFPFIIYSHIILLLFSFSLRWLILGAEQTIEKQYRHLLYAIIIAAHTGFVGILVTGDIFNLYVFIEIASLASYALISLGRNKFAVVGAFEYLIIGTIGATLILLGIGMLFSVTGTLNMKHMHNLLPGHYSSHMVQMGILLFIIGTLIKVALFPLHFWMVKAYTYTTGIILTYIASISGVTGFYILLRFIYSVIGLDAFIATGMDIGLSTIGICAIIICSIPAYLSTTLRQIVLFSATIQVGYICIMIANKGDIALCMRYIFADGLMKLVLFYFITQVEIGRRSIKIYELEGLAHRYPILCAIMTFNIISNMGMPITIGFFNKLNLLYLLIQSSNYIAFVAVIIASIIGVEYNFRLIRALYTGTTTDSIKLFIPGNLWGLFLTTSLGFGLIFI